MTLDGIAQLIDVELLLRLAQQHCAHIATRAHPVDLNSDLTEVGLLVESCCGVILWQDNLSPTVVPYANCCRPVSMWFLAQPTYGTYWNVLDILATCDRF